MATKLALTRGSKGRTTEPKKKTRELIQLIETPPKSEWFVHTREHGRMVWYLRFAVTGMLLRRFGPFQSRHRALLALDSMIASLTDAKAGLYDAADKYILQRRVPQNWGPVIEDALALPKGGR
jgi:hypothetical protein